MGTVGKLALFAVGFCTIKAVFFPETTPTRFHPDRAVTGHVYTSTELPFVDPSKTLHGTGQSITLVAGTKLTHLWQFDNGNCAVVFDELDVKGGTIYEWAVLPCNEVHGG